MAFDLRLMLLLAPWWVASPSAASQSTTAPRVEERQLAKVVGEAYGLDFIVDAARAAGATVTDQPGEGRRIITIVAAANASSTAAESPQRLPHQSVAQRERPCSASPYDLPADVQAEIAKGRASRAAVSDRCENGRRIVTVERDGRSFRYEHSSSTSR